MFHQRVWYSNSIATEFDTLNVPEPRPKISCTNTHSELARSQSLHKWCCKFWPSVENLFSRSILLEITSKPRERNKHRTASHLLAGLFCWQRKTPHSIFPAVYNVYSTQVARQIQSEQPRGARALSTKDILWLTRSDLYILANAI